MSGWFYVRLVLCPLPGTRGQEGGRQPRSQDFEGEGAEPRGCEAQAWKPFFRNFSRFSKVNFLRFSRFSSFFSSYKFKVFKVFHDKFHLNVELFEAPAVKILCKFCFTCPFVSMPFCSHSFCCCAHMWDVGSQASHGYHHFSVKRQISWFSGSVCDFQGFSTVFVVTFGPLQAIFKTFK